MQARMQGSSLLLASALVLSASASCADTATPTSNSGLSARSNSVAALNQVTAASQEVCGPIATTLVIRENTRLSCDVICTNSTGPCIQFGRDNITLWLNGHTMSGSATPPTGCATSPAFGPPPNPGPFPFDGISTAGFDNVKIRGPGMVQMFRRHGVFVFDSERAVVQEVTSHYNCFSGIFMGAAHDNDVIDNVSVRNGAASAGAPCGGNCVSSSNGNRIRWNHYYGNGSVASGPPGGTPNDFGVGLVGSSTNNRIEDNSIGGNITGVFIVPSAIGNVIARNIIAGNPPIQVSVTAGTPVGVDIRDFSPANSNSFVENHCITYEGSTTPAPCPNFPNRRGHR
jgi:parallel beta-helix repeat protein